jgi:hypothetical protein
MVQTNSDQEVRIYTSGELIIKRPSLCILIKK